MVEPWVPHYPTRPSTASFPGLDARRPEPKNEGLSVPTTRPTRSREARPFRMPLVSFRSSLFKAFDDASPPRRGTRRGGPLPTAPAHDARSRARTRAGDQDDPARARPRRRAFPPPPQRPEGSTAPPRVRRSPRPFASSEKKTAATPHRPSRPRSSTCAPPPRASPSPSPLPSPSRRPPRARSPCRRREGCITPTAARWGRSTGAVFLETRDPRALSTLLRPS